MIHLRTLGTSEIRAADRPMTPATGKLFALLLYLAVERGRRVQRATLVTMLSPHAGERDAAHNFRQLLYQAKRVTPEILCVGSTLELPPNAVTDDYSALAGRETIDDDVLASIAHGILPGFSPPLADAYIEWLEAHRREVGMSLLRQISATMAAAEARGEWRRVASAARAALAIDSLHRDATLSLSKALAMLGMDGHSISVLERYSSEVGEKIPAHAVPARKLRERIARVQQGDVPREVPLHGRATELAALRRHWRLASEGRTQTVVLHGPGGIGKTRLLQTLRSEVTLEGATVISATARATDRTRPLSIFSEINRQLRRQPGALGCAPAALVQLDRFATMSLDAVDGTVAPAASEDTTSALMFAIVELIEAVASETPLVLMVDDAQHLDEVSWREVHVLASRTERCSLLVVLATRDEGLDIARRTSWHSSFLPIAPLADAECESLLGSLVPSLQKSREASQIAALLRTTGGNPFFVLALARICEESVTTPSIPVDQIIGERLRRLGTMDLTVLQLIAVLEQYATPSMLVALLKCSPLELLNTLTTLQLQQLVIGDQPVLRPAHDLIADNALALLPSSSRAALHALCAQQLDSLPQMADGSLLWARANHWIRAGDFERASLTLEECGRYATGLGHQQSAAESFSTAAELSASVKRKAHLLQLSLEAATVSDDKPLFLKNLQLLREITGQSPHSVTHDDTEWRENQALFAVGTHPSRIIARLKDCVTSQATPTHRLRAASDLVRFAWESCDTQLRQWTIEASQLTPVSDPETTFLRGWLAYLDRFGFGNIDGIVPDALHMLNVDPVLQRRVGITTTSMACFVLYFSGEVTAALKLLQSYYHRLTAHGQRRPATWCSGVLAEVALELGQIDLAREWLERALHTSRALISFNIADGIASVRIRLAMIDGDYITAQRILQESLEAAAALEFGRLGAVKLAYQIRLAIALGTPLMDHLTELHRQYPVLRLGMQSDEPVSAIIQGLRLCDRLTEATLTLEDYLRVRRIRSPLSADLCREGELVLARRVHDPHALSHVEIQEALAFTPGIGIDTPIALASLNCSLLARPEVANDAPLSFMVVPSR